MSVSATIAKRNETTWTSPNSTSPQMESLRRNFLAQSAMRSIAQTLKANPKRGPHVVREMLLSQGYEMRYVPQANVLIFKSIGSENFTLELRLSDDSI